MQTGYTAAKEWPGGSNPGPHAYLCLTTVPGRFLLWGSEDLLSGFLISYAGKRKGSRPAGALKPSGQEVYFSV